MARKMVPYDGNTAVAYVAHATNEIIAIYPITPSSGMGEMADEKSAGGEKNIWGTIPTVTEMQSEGGASAAVHGALTSGALTTTFTASQGLLLMIPSMYKIAGELCPTVFHVSARSLACQALSIFGDHSDIMAVRSTGFGLLGSGTMQEIMDFALISQAVTLESRIPFVHFFEGFRGSHEIQKIEELTYDDMKTMMDDDLVRAHKSRGMNPEKPILRGTSQNPDVYFQGRETVNKYYLQCPQIVQNQMDKFASLTGRQYHLFDYAGMPEAENLVVVMGSGAETVNETIDYVNKDGGNFGMVKVNLYRPFNVEAFINTLPPTVKKIAVLDRTKEPGAPGEPLYQDVCSALYEGHAKNMTKFQQLPQVIGGRYGLGSKEFTAAMVKGVLDNLNSDNPKDHFTIGINDDVANTSLDFQTDFSAEGDTYGALFYGLGSDGTVGANKNSVKIIADNSDKYTQAYFVYDSKKAGAVTVSHLRIADEPIRSRYLVYNADFVGCHNFTFLEKFDILKYAKPGSTFLLTSEYNAKEVWDKMPREIQQQLIDKKMKLFVIDAIKIGEEIGLGARINVIMQTAFFKISGVIDQGVAIKAIRDAIQKTYGSKGEKVVQMNVSAIDRAIEGIEEVEIPSQVTSSITRPDVVPEHAPDFVKDVTAIMLRQEGDDMKVSQMPVDGTWPVSTTQYEKRNIALSIPVWNPESCIQCGACSLYCPHAAIRMKIYDPSKLEGKPETFKSIQARGKEFKTMACTLQVAPEDCTGCGVCIETCTSKKKDAILLEHQTPLRASEAENWKFFLNLPEVDSKLVKPATVRGSQLIRPLFEFSGACSGCGETPYVKLMTQLFGDRAIIANATGCSSIYGGNLPTTPYCTRDDGRGPTWNNSLFEDTAEVAMGMRLTVDKFNQFALELVDRVMAMDEGKEIADLLQSIKNADQTTLDGIEAQRQRVSKLKDYLLANTFDLGQHLTSVSDYLISKSVWGIGGDGWAYDIGYGGLDHVLASGKNVNLLVLDTEVYSNTGGQQSKATPRGAVAQFAAGGKPLQKKDMGLIFMSYGNVYIASIAMGANRNQTVKAFAEAEAYDGPSLILAYSNCIAHGINMTTGMDEQKKAVLSGHWPLYRYNPDLAKQGKNPLVLESKEPSISMEEYTMGENRFRVLKKRNPEAAATFLRQSQKDAVHRYNLYKQLSQIDYSHCLDQ